MSGRREPSTPASGRGVRPLPRRLALLAACWAALAALPAVAQEADTQSPPVAETLPAGVLVDRLLREGRIDEAEALLERLRQRDPRDEQLVFLTGMVAMTRGDNRRAIRLFRAILIDNPKAARVRLELARAYFLDQDYVNADRQFRLAWAGNHPPEVIANIDQYLYAIREAKDWSWSLSVALAPDTNLNAGTSSREVSLYGLPFELSEDARGHSGIGLSAEGAMEFAPRIGAHTRLRMGLAAQRREYSGNDFDDMGVAAYAGPRFVSPRWDVSVLATGFKRWYGAEPLLHAAGGRVEATHYPSPDLGLSGSVAAQMLDHARDDARDGALYSANFGLFHPLNSTSAISVRAGANRQTAHDPAYANWSVTGSLGYLRELPAGFTVSFQPTFGLARYDGVLAAFGEKRSDRSISGELTLLNRHLVLSRFTPRIAYTLTRQWSSIPLNGFTRHRVEVGLVTVF